MHMQMIYTLARAPAVIDADVESSHQRVHLLDKRAGSLQKLGHLKECFIIDLKHICKMRFWNDEAMEPGDWILVEYDKRLYTMYKSTA